LLNWYLRSGSKHLWVHCSIILLFTTLDYRVHYSTILYSHSTTGGDLLRSVPFIMGGHLNMDFFQVVFAQVFDTNPKSICLMMIHKHSGRAPRPFQHLLLAMSALEMSGHDTKRLSWFFWSKSFQILCVKYINKTYYNAYFYFSDYCAASKSGKMGTVRPCQNHVWTSRN